MNVIEPGATPPWEPLRARLEAEAGTLAAEGQTVRAETLRQVVQAWWTEQERWNARAADVLSVHHDINNALVGIRGNAQLLLMNPAVQTSGIRERLEVMLRESSRIQEATARLRELKTGLGGSAPGNRAA
ncbi:MAG TPA: histidine kinase dimerization/phospho-acceptor domain-containing protein [Candidatus Acidoferrales bacterium]|nr:histidine kinase dimerization/phospho-acceptor domain-containing protein [Candidatus Acidoferrales bacterium]